MKEGAPLGVVLDRYQLTGRLGRGGMGTVWRATDGLLGREVAVKEIRFPEGLEDGEIATMRDRVLREARAAARLGHQGGVTVFDVAQDENGAFIVMELVEGESLSELVERDGPLEPRRAAEIGAQVVDVLEAAHAAHIIHRDVKPANVLLDRAGRVKLTDFGIARLRDDVSLTGTGQVLGSPRYMAPEQATGETVPESDLWGLGVTLYFAVEGRAPFDRDSAMATLTAVVHDDPPPPQRAGALRPAIEALLRKEPSERPSITELREMLARVASEPGEDTAAFPGPDADEASEAPEDQDAVMSTEELFAAIRPPARPAPVEPPRAPPVAPAPQPSSTEWEEEPAEERRSRAGVAALAAILVLAAGVAVWWLMSRPEPVATSGSGPDPTPSATAAASPSPSLATVPAGWEAYTDPTVGYEISHPPGWDPVVLDGTRTDFRDPETGAYLRVDWTDTPGPSPVKAWRSYAKVFAAEHEGYRKIRIDPAEYQGYRAAEWEFTFEEDGVTLHGLDLGFVTGDFGFALYFQTSEDEWEALQDEFEGFKASFEVPE